MRTVRDGDGSRHLLLEWGAESSLVYDPRADEQRRLPTATLDADDADPLVVAAHAVPSDPVPPIDRVDGAGRGLLVDLADRGPRTVREMLDVYARCESDLHGLLAECRVAGLIEAATVAGERGYGVTDRAEGALRASREDGHPEE
jgi:hypothetical protein